MRNRRAFNADFKACVVLAVLSGAKTAAEVALSMTAVGEAWQHGYAERVIRTIKEEEVNLSDYHDFHDAYQQTGRFLTDVYNRKRIHSSLGCLTPADFAASLPEQQHVVVALVP